MGIPWDGTSINCYGMGQVNMSHGQPWVCNIIFDYSRDLATSFDSKSSSGSSCAFWGGSFPKIPVRGEKDFLREILNILNLCNSYATRLHCIFTSDNHNANA